MILTRSTRLNQPRGPVEVDRQSLLTVGVEFAYIPGFSRDLNGKHGTIQSVGPSTSFLNGTMVTPGTVRNNGLILASGALLGPLQQSTVLAIVNTMAGLTAASGSETDGLIGSAGNAIYSERASTGNDIYKLSLQTTSGPTLNAEFAYRNDGATLLQQRAAINGYNDGRQLAVAAVKNGTSHSVYCESISSTGTFGSASSAFTNANIQRLIGSDIADSTCPWNGQILLVVGWSRALSAFEIAEVKDNPWQLFRPVQRRIYFDMGAGEPATHDTSGAITSSPAELSGAAGRTRQHDTSAELAGAGSVVSATARRNVTLGSAGTLSGGLAVVTASASHAAGHAEHSTSGTVAAPGASLSGSASRVPAPVTHDASGDLGGMGAVIDGQAQGPQTGSMRPGFEMSSRKVYIKRGKRIHIFDSVEDADAWMEAEQQELQAIRRAKPTPRKKAKVFKALDEAIPHEVVRLDVVRAMVDYLGIPVEMPTLEARQDWAEVARVALMARQMQDEEDIELLLAA